MANRPQTLYGLADSPVGLAAWMLDHDARSYELIARAFDGQAVGELTRDDVLDNITLYWLTNTGVSAARLYWENKLAFFDVKGVDLPVAVSVFPDELYQAPRSWAEQAYPNLIHFNELDEGRPLRRLGAAELLLRRRCARVQVAAVNGGDVHRRRSTEHVVERPAPLSGRVKQIDAGVLNVGYVDAGPADGPAVVLLHGWPYDIHSYADVAPLLASEGYRVIVPYLRGYGTTRFLPTRPSATASRRHSPSTPSP